MHLSLTFARDVALHTASTITACSWAYKRRVKNRVSCACTAAVDSHSHPPTSLACLPAMPAPAHQLLAAIAHSLTLQSKKAVGSERARCCMQWSRVTNSFNITTALRCGDATRSTPETLNYSKVCSRRLLNFARERCQRAASDI
jgi:hypothetical protein